jgi:putative ABC transport system ATP-binding protein
MTPVVRFDGIALTYPGPPPVPALKPCDLEVAPGERLAIMGPSGSGKSTLLNVAGLLDRPTQGTYELDGIDTGSLRERDRTALRAQRIGFVFQSFQLLPYRSAEDNVLLAMLYSPARRTDRRKLARQALERVGLADRLHALPGTLSGGEQQRVAIARGLVNRPSLLLCDEPTGNLDSATGASVLSLLDELHADGLTIIVITHDARVAAHAERMVTISDGVLSEAAVGSAVTAR